MTLSVNAATTSGYTGWYCSEIFCDEVAELDLLGVARTPRGVLEILVR